LNARRLPRFNDKMAALRPTHSHSYRPDIDGLRAVSILAVVGYHAGIPSLSGGFVGVDVFFVISGYLITGLLLGELERTGRIDFFAFYARRARRLLPAAALVVVATLLAGALLLSPALGEVQRLARSALAVLAICANLYFLRHANDYFAVPVDQHPLLHAWSLSIEEQFYLIWPMLMLLGWQIGAARGCSKRTLGATIVAASLGAAILAGVVSAKSPMHAFYLMPARAWELGAGAMLAMLLPRLREIQPRIGASLAAVGFGMIVASCVYPGPGSAFPFPLALIPVLGALLVIGGNVGAPGNLVARLLTTRAMVTIGLASYAWYLWHWPVLAIARVRALGEPELLRDASLAMGSLGLALLTMRYVEQPFRFGIARAASARRVLQASAAATAGVAAIALATGWAAKELPVSAIDAAAKNARADQPEFQSLCHASEWPDPDQDARCLVADGARRIIVWGDSHADHWTPAFHAWAESAGTGLAIEQWTLDACPPLFDALPTAVLTAQRVGFEECRNFNESVRRRLTSIAPSDRHGIVMASNWWYRTGDVRWKPTEPAHSFDLSAIGEVQSLAALEHYLRESLREITTQGYQVMVILQSPVLAQRAPECVVRLGPAACATTLVAHRQRADAVNSVVRRVVDEFSSVRALDPSALLCDGAACPAMYSGIVAYTDTNHLAASLARALAPRIDDVLRPLAD
jgi:peptidoglycan/LPS O-acetylase OafA/YrhL